jgi:hypothetical protein
MEYMKPIEKPDFIGCITCGNMAKKILNKDTTLKSNYTSTVTLNGRIIKNDTLLKHLIAEDGSLLQFESPLRDETYQLQNNEWVLVEQGMGYA